MSDHRPDRRRSSARRRRRSPPRPPRAQLEDVRIRFLGRKAELPNLLRGVAQLPPEERAATGKAANQARQALEAAIEAKAGDLAAAELDARLEQDRIDVTLPADPLPAIGRLHLMTRTRREIEDVFIGLGFNVAEGPEVETVYYNFDALNHAPTHPSRLETDTFYMRRRTTTRSTSSTPTRGCCASTPRRRRSTRCRASRRRSTSSCPAASTGPTPTPPTRRSSIRSRGWPSTRTSPWPICKGTLLTFARAIFGERARGPPAPALLPVHRAERRGRRLVLQLHAGDHRRRPALPAVQGHGLDRDPRLRDGRPQRVRPRRRPRL